MTLEQRIIEALHSTEGYAPSPDLFARVTRSLEEDRAHRKRVWFWSLVAATMMTAWVVLLTQFIHPTSVGPVAPRWFFEASGTVVILTLLVVLGPALRRFGSAYVDDVFHLQPETGRRFVRLVEIAYYLSGSGYVLVTTDLGGLQLNQVLGVGAKDTLERVAIVVAAMGLGHAQNLLLLPFVGMFYNATRRRVLRFEAGAGAPSMSVRSRKADRVVTVIAFTLVTLGAAGALVFVGLLLGGA
jgi:hypothetical protein